MAIDNYLYQYADGTTGNSPFRRGPDGMVLTNAQGGIQDEGRFMGRSMPDGSVNQATLGNVTPGGMVDTYGGYQSSANDYYSNGAAGQRPPDGYGTATQPFQAQPGGSLGFGGGSAAGGQGAAPGGMQPQAGNPYLQQMGDALTQQMTSNFQRKVAPQIASGAMASGGFGGSRQGVIEANAANDLNQNISSGLSGLYGNAYGQELQYDLGRRNNATQQDLGIRNNALGFGNLGLGYANLDRTINNDNNSWQLQGAQFGLGVQNQLQQQNQAGIQSGTNIQNTPMNYWSQFSNQANSIGQGYGTTTGSTSAQGSPIVGALGGAQLGSQIGQLWGSSPNAAGGSSGGGWGTGAGFGNQDFGGYY